MNNDTTGLITVSEIMPHIRAANAIYMFQKRKLAVQTEIITEQQSEIMSLNLAYNECSEQRDRLEGGMYLMELRLDEQKKIETQLRKQNKWMATGVGALMVYLIINAIDL